MKLLAALFFAASFPVAAQIPEVPRKMTFAGMTLTIRDDARQEIQKDVNALTQSPRHYNIKAERARTYFPIIEKIFYEEGVPDDFKFLVLQESSLVPDAVSVSNAVGFWQFKDFTAIEMGLRVDKHIDERMNIASSTRAAARYIKKNNTFFDNWLYALQAYQMGAGGVQRSLKEPHNGERRAEITSETYWYIKKFLAHKIAFEDGCKGPGQLVITPLENKKRNSLSVIAKDFSIDEAELRNYNKWTKSGDIPDDRAYVVIIPGTSGVSSDIYVSNDLVIKKSEPIFPSTEPLVTKKINGVVALQAKAGETPEKIARRGRVYLSDFLRWNDMAADAQIEPNAYYFLSKKRARASEDYHTFVKGESLWSVSQRYGIRLKRLKRLNRLETEVIPIGAVLYLSSRKPKTETAPVSSGEVVELNTQETFNWPDQNQQNLPDESVLSTVLPETDSVIVSSDNFTMREIVSEDSTQILQQAKDGEIRSTESVQPPNSVEKSAIQPTNSEHVVQAKETLYAIAKIYNVGVMDLVNWNNLDLQQGLKIGQVLKVSDPEVIAKAPTVQEMVHEVKPTDTLYSIARKYSVTIKEIMEWNDKKDFSVSVGEKLKVKSSQ